MLDFDIERYIEESKDEIAELLGRIAVIPAPSGNEELRAEFVKDWLTANGADGVYIDSALNVIYPVGCEGKNSITVFMAHTDTVFPDTAPMPYHTDSEYAYAPGVGDDTASLAVLLMIAKYVAKKNLTTKGGILFVANSGEEGLGNLRGTKQLMADFSGRISEVFTLDSANWGTVDKCVGSHRYRIKIKSEGGHSFSKFGNTNAIAVMARLIDRLYGCEVPKIGNSQTTYNVGTVSGGTSVNTIAEDAEMLYEYRSDEVLCLDYMKSFFEQTVESIRRETDAEITVETIGIRPCASKEVDCEHHERLVCRCIEATELHSGRKSARKSSSTDCNIPMSLGIPAVCFSVYEGFGAHTRGERVLVSSLTVGMRVAADIILDYFERI